MITPHKLNSIGYRWQVYSMAIRVENLFLRKLAFKLFVAYCNRPPKFLTKKRAEHDAKIRQMRMDFYFVASRLIPEVNSYADISMEVEGSGVWYKRKVFLTLS